MIGGINEEVLRDLGLSQNGPNTHNSLYNAYMGWIAGIVSQEEGEYAHFDPSVPPGFGPTKDYDRLKGSVDFVQNSPIVDQEEEFENVDGEITKWVR